MRLEISEAVAFAVDIILLTFILVWEERQNERAKGGLAPVMGASTPQSTLLA